MPTLTYQGDINITLQGPGDGVLQPTLSSSPPSDVNSLDAGVWPQGSSTTWGGGSFATDESFFPNSQYCQFFPTGFSTWNFTDSASGVSVETASAIVLDGRLYLYYVDLSSHQLVFFEYVLPGGPTNAIGTHADVPFSHPFGSVLSTSFSINALFVIASAIGAASVCYLQLDGFSNSFLYLYPELVGISSAAISNGILPRNSPDFQSGINYTTNHNGAAFDLSRWQIVAGSVSILSAPTTIGYDAPLTARGVVDIKPCAFGWLLKVGTLGTTGKNTTFVLASRDMTKYWSLILSPSPLSTGFGFSDGNFGLQLDARGFLYQHSSTANLFATLASQLALLPLSPSVPTLTISCNNPPAAQPDASYSHTLTANGGVLSYTFALTAGALPPGLTLDPATGVISGTAAHLLTQLSYPFTVRLTDGAGTQVSVSCSIAALYAFSPVDNIWESGLARGSELSASMIRLAAFDVWVRGNGALGCTVYGPDKVLSQTPQLLLASGVPATALATNPGIMYALKLDFRQIENFTIRFETNTLDGWFELSGFRTYIKSDLYNR